MELSGAASGCSITEALDLRLFSESKRLVIFFLGLNGVNQGFPTLQTSDHRNAVAV